MTTTTTTKNWWKGGRYLMWRRAAGAQVTVSNSVCYGSHSPHEVKCQGPVCEVTAGQTIVCLPFTNIITNHFFSCCQGWRVSFGICICFNRFFYLNLISTSHRFFHFVSVVCSSFLMCMFPSEVRRGGGVCNVTNAASTAHTYRFIWPLTSYDSQSFPSVCEGEKAYDYSLWLKQCDAEKKGVERTDWHSHLRAVLKKRARMEEKWTAMVN